MACWCIATAQPSVQASIMLQAVRAFGLSFIPAHLKLTVCSQHLSMLTRLRSALYTDASPDLRTLLLPLRQQIAAALGSQSWGRSGCTVRGADLHTSACLAHQAQTDPNAETCAIKPVYACFHNYLERAAVVACRHGCNAVTECTCTACQ